MAKDFQIQYLRYVKSQELAHKVSQIPREHLHQCDLCDSKRFAIISWLDRYGFKEVYMLCMNCGLIFLNPRPTLAGYQEFYSGIYRRLVGSTKDKLIEEEERYSRNLVKYLKLANVIKPGMKALDVGGSLGITAYMLKEEGVECEVLDPAGDELEYAHSLNVKTHQGFAENFSTDQKYD
ncbi:MAG: class I SAM-dependent methyltransferase, partial [bacterium]